MTVDVRRHMTRREFGIAVTVTGLASLSVGAYYWIVLWSFDTDAKDAAMFYVALGIASIVTGVGLWLSKLLWVRAGAVAMFVIFGAVLFVAPLIWYLCVAFPLIGAYALFAANAPQPLGKKDAF